MPDLAPFPRQGSILYFLKQTFYAAAAEPKELLTFRVPVKVDQRPAGQDSIGLPMLTRSVLHR